MDDSDQFSVACFQLCLRVRPSIFTCFFHVEQILALRKPCIFTFDPTAHNIFSESKVKYYLYNAVNLTDGTRGGLLCRNASKDFIQVVTIPGLSFKSPPQLIFDSLNLIHVVTSGDASDKCR